MESAAPSDTQFQQLKMLLDYTVFHIGMYATLVSGMIAVMSLDIGKLRVLYLLPFRLMIFFFILAGISGGVIGSNIPAYDNFGIFMDTNIGFWDFALLKAKYWVTLEHTAFWLGITVGFISFFKEKSRQKQNHKK